MRQRKKAFTAVVAILIVVALILSFWPEGDFAKSESRIAAKASAEELDEPTAAPTLAPTALPTEEPTATPFPYYFYNKELAENKIEGDEFNFGPSVEAEAARKEIEKFNKAMDSLVKTRNIHDEDIDFIIDEAWDNSQAVDTSEENLMYHATVQYYDYWMRERLIAGKLYVDDDDVDGALAEYAKMVLRHRMEKDPALGAAVMAYFDELAGTPFVKNDYYSYETKDWEQAINAAKKDFILNPDVYKLKREAFFAFLDKSTKASVGYSKSGINDQMYMYTYPEEVNGEYMDIPYVVAMETTNHDGWFLKFTFTIKETKEVVVPYRLDCGFQPTNVGKAMGMKVQKRKTSSTPAPKPKKTPTPPKPTPVPTPKVTPKPTPKPTPAPTPTPSQKPKDKTKGTPPSADVVKPNDDPGPGPDTNNPKNPTHSTMEDKNTSSALKDYPEYKETIDNLKDINEKQKAGGDPNTTTVKVPDSTAVDSNADNGTGNGGIDKPTETSKPVDGYGNDLKNDPSHPAQPWGGPAD